MFRLVYAKVHISLDNMWKAIVHLAVIIQELEKYGLGFLEVNPKSVVQAVDGTVHLAQFYGVIHPYVNLADSDLKTENLV